MDNLPPLQDLDDMAAARAAQKSPEITRAKSKRKPESSLEENIKSIFWAIMLALLIRALVVEPFSIPSGSMVPTLLEGDYLFVTKPSYGYSARSIGYGFLTFPGRIGLGETAPRPARGDVVVFKLTSDPRIDYIKRVIGLPGDRIQVKEGRLYINDKMVPRRLVKDDYKWDSSFDSKPEILHEYIETLPNGVEHHIVEKSDHEALDDTQEYKVPSGYYFMMGDNRDHSQDSRVNQEIAEKRYNSSNYVGFVPEENLVGPAKLLFFSLGNAQPWELWKWPSHLRFSRILTKLNDN